MTPLPRGRPATIVHHVVCRHRVEVEVAPARATLAWQDERWTDPVNTQLRFSATVFNAGGGVAWQVLAPDGGPGAGSIDATGLYRAPPRNFRPSGFTDLVVATPRADPLRKATAFVTLVGLGPLPAPAPRVEIWPKRATLFYQGGARNDFIAAANKQLLFRAFLADAPGPGLRWAVNGAVQPGSEPFFLYQAPGSGGGAVVTVTASSTAAPAATDAAKIILQNNTWPGF